MVLLIMNECQTCLMGIMLATWRPVRSAASGAITFHINPQPASDLFLCRNCNPEHLQDKLLKSVMGQLNVLSKIKTKKLALSDQK